MVYMKGRARVARAVFPPPEQVAEVKAVACELPSELGVPISRFSRLNRDVLSVPGLHTVLLLEGTNDIGGGSNAPPAPASQVIDAMKLIIRRVHEHNVPIVGATILPMCNPPGSSREQVRTTVNNWIRSSGAFDAVLDFDAVLRDPANPTQIIPDLRHDCYHPNAAGDALLGLSIPLWVLGVPAGDHSPLRIGQHVAVSRAKHHRRHRVRAAR
jgi:hypothetical protein